MQLKSKYSGIASDLGLQRAGIFITAITLSLIHLRINYLIHVPHTITWLTPALLFCAVVFVYSADHYYDSRKLVESGNLNKADQSNVLFMVVFGALGSLILFVFRKNFYFFQTWPVFALVAAYGLMLWLKIRLPGAKEIMIATTVSMSLLLNAENHLFKLFFYPSFYVIFVICLQNLIVFGYFEKGKDDRQNNFTLFYGWSDNSASMMAIILILILMAGNFMFHLKFDTLFPYAWISSMFYLMMVLKPGIFRKMNMYRVVADIVLLALIF